MHVFHVVTVYAMDVITVELHHGGAFHDLPILTYKGGLVETFQNFNFKYLSSVTLKTSMESLGYMNVSKLHYKFSTEDFFYGLETIESDHDILFLQSKIKGGETLQIYLEHSVDSMEDDIACGDEDGVDGGDEGGEYGVNVDVDVDDDYDWEQGSEDGSDETESELSDFIETDDEVEEDLFWTPADVEAASAKNKEDVRRWIVGGSQFDNIHLDGEKESDYAHSDVLLTPSESNSEDMEPKRKKNVLSSMKRQIWARLSLW